MFRNMNIIMQNVVTVEDDRPDIPILAVAKDYSSLIFAVLRFNKILAFKILRVQKEEF